MKNLLGLLLVGVVLACALLTYPVHAEEIFNEACSGAGGTSAVCETQTSQNPVSGPGGILSRVNRFIAVAAGVIAVIIIIISGIRFTTSHGDPQSVNSAKNAILFTVIGLIVVLIAQGIISYVINAIYK